MIAVLSFIFYGCASSLADLARNGQKEEIRNRVTDGELVGSTTMEISLGWNDPEFVEFLFKHAGFDKKDEDFIQIAIEKYHNEKIAKALLKSGAKVSCASIESGIEFCSADLVTLMLNKITKDWCSESTFIKIAIDSKNPTILRAILQRGIDPNQMIGIGMEETSELREHGCVQKVSSMIITRGNEVNDFRKVTYMCSVESTPLILAVQSGQPELVKIILEFGGVPYLTDSYGKRASDYADSEAIKNLLKH